MKPPPPPPDLSVQLDDLFTKINPNYDYNPDEANTPIRWDWPGWLAPGYLTILTGQPGVGKSSLSLHLAISYCSGRAWPDGTPFTATPGKTLWVESQSNLRLHLQRLRDWGLNPRQLVTLLFTLRLRQPQPHFNLTEQRDFHGLILSASRPDVRLIVLDSLSDLLATDTRPRLIQDLLITFARIARYLDKPILITHNLSQPLIFDSHGRVNLPRLLGPEISRLPHLIWGLDLPAGPQHRRLSVIKNNLTAFPPPLGFRIDDAGLHFGPPPSTHHHSQLAQARHFLQNLLADGPLPAAQIFAAAQAAGHALPTIKRAKKQLHIQSTRQPDQWLWHLHPQDPHATP